MPTATVLPSPRRPLALAMAWALSLGSAAALGFHLHRTAVPAAPAAAPAVRAATHPPLPEAPLIALAADGRITLRVEQQPLDWVLEQIALQGGPALAPPAVAAAPAVVAPPVAPACVPSTAARGSGQAWRLLIEHGTDDERADALLQASMAGASVPEPLVLSLMQGAPSPRVQLAALEHWVSARSGDAGAERAALEYALQLAGPALQQEARQRLDDLAQRERLDAEGQRPDAP